MTWKLRLNGRIQKQAQLNTIDEFFAPTPTLLLPQKEIITLQNNENCLHCGLFSVCDNPHKAGNYVCDNFQQRTKRKHSFDLSDLGIFDQGSRIPQIINKSGSYSDLDNIVITNNHEMDALLDKITKQFSSGQLRDLRVDDSDLPLAKNYVDFWYNPIFVGTGEVNYPFPKQVEMAINLYSEWCPKCSNPTYVKNIPVDATLDGMLEQIQLLEHGICPKCKKTRLDFWDDPLLQYKRYTGMIGIAGQRCVSGDTLIPTTKGLIRIDSLNKEKHKGDWEQLNDVFVYTRQGIKNACALYSSKEKEDLLVLYMFDGTIIKGTPEHPVLNARGELTKLKYITRQDSLRRYDKETNQYYLIKINSISTGKDYVYDFHVPFINEFMTQNGYINGNSGKTAGLSRINGYHSHRMFKLNRPAKVFGIEDNAWMEACFTATTFSKALDNFYDPLVSTMRTNHWFKQYLEMLDYHSGKLGHQLYKILGETMFFNHKNYIFYPKSPDPSNMRGANRFMAEIDELSHLWAAKGDDAKQLNPHEVYTVLRNSLWTLRAAYNRLIRRGLFDVPPVIMCNVTSPRSMGDYGMRLYRLSQDKDSDTYGFHYSVYEANPHAKGDPELEQMKRENPEAFKRDFMAIPPSAHNAFIEDKNVVKACVSKEVPNGITLKQAPIRGHSKNIRLMSADFEIRTSAKVDKQRTHKVMAVDAGLKYNSFAFCIAHLETREDAVGNEELHRVYDVLGEIIPENDHIISIADVYNDVINPLIDEFNVIHFSADRWNSAKLLGDISNDYGIETKQYSCKMKDFVDFRTGLISGDIKLPMQDMKLDEAFDLSAYNYPICFKGKPVAHAMVQMLTVENYIKSVEKGGKYTDDIFRAMVLANHFLVDDNLREELLAPTNPVVDTSVFIGAFAGGTGTVNGIGGSSLGITSTRGGSDNNPIGSLVSLSGFGR